jgi:hypothetical protein
MFLKNEKNRTIFSSENKTKKIFYLSSLFFLKIQISWRRYRYLELIFAHNMKMSESGCWEAHISLFIFLIAVVSSVRL